MKLEDILKKFLQSASSPKSVEGLAGNFESIGKLSAALLAIFYVVGLIIFGLYYSSLHIRSIELFKVRYLFVGFYYLAFLFLHLVYPHWWIKRSWAKVLYVLILAVFIIGLLNYDRIHLLYFLTTFPLPDPDLGFGTKSEILEILKYFAAFLILLFLSTFLFSYSLSMAANSGRKVLGRFFVFYAFFAIAINYYIFATFFFPKIPEAIGGGQPPVVGILFKDTIPIEVSSKYASSSGKSPFRFEGRLVHMDGDSAFLQVPDPFSDDVYEFQRSDIAVLVYIRTDTAEMEALWKMKFQLPLPP